METEKTKDEDNGFSLSVIFSALAALIILINGIVKFYRNPSVLFRIDRDAFPRVPAS